MSPPKKASNRATTPVQAKSNIIEGPTANTGNFNAFFKGGKKK